MAIQTTNRTQVTAVRLIISHRQASTDRIGITGMNGTLNERSRSGRVLRSTTTPMETNTNVNSVPTLTISSSTPISENPAIIATATPTPTVILAGVPVFSLTCAMPRGSRPSRLIAKMIRLWPSISTSTTVVSPASAPIAITFAAQSTPTAVKALASVAASPSWVPSGSTGPSWSYGTIAVSTTVTNTYSTVTMTSEPMMARGRSFFGLRVSSAAVATMSNPMKAKNTSDAAVSTPNTPKLDGAPPSISCSSGCSRPPDAPSAAGTLGGMNGERLAELKKKKPTTITSSTTPILIAVMIMLAREESLVPSASNP